MLNTELEKINSKGNVNELWEEIKTVMKECAAGCQDKKGKRRKEWFYDSCKEILTSRNKARLKMLSNDTEETKQNYLKERRECKKLLRNKKRKHREQFIRELEENFKNKEVRTLYMGLRKEKQGHKQEPMFLKGENGELITDEDKIIKRWKEYFEKLLNREMESEYLQDEVDRFKYLGTIFKRQPGVSEEINSRITAGNRCIGTLNAVLKNKGISRKLKMRIYKTVIRPIVIFGSEVWTLRKEEVQRIEVWERKVLRKIFGGKIQGGRWERRTNREIYDLFKEPNIIGIRMRWIGHVVRMKDHRIPKMVLIHEIGGGKRLGRPRQRWKKAVEDDIRKLNIGNWKEKAKDRKEWKNIVDQAMGQLGS
ncbi:hypothetical protein NQ318_016961 [Aromia moschata]|uniref:Endonuclease-reverse transcriptase n=1 Tax=Aromia moschata TaxID=1265417 RepID=A0AAV8YBP5_9CUCU|nr:hypothetical protein NQ318_016961 [Aromia moschata]